MDIDGTERREGPTGKDETGKGRCGWIALGLAILLVAGMAPLSLLFGMAGMETVVGAWGRPPWQGFMGRMMVAAAMTLGILVSSVILLSLAAIARGMTRSAIRSIHFATGKRSL